MRSTTAFMARNYDRSVRDAPESIAVLGWQLKSSGPERKQTAAGAKAL